MRNLNFSVLALCCCFFVLTNNSLSQVPSSVPSNGLIGWWPFNGNGNDESGNGNNGSVYGATLAPDKNGILNSAYSFDGINDRIEFTDKNFSNIKFSVSIWVNAQTSSGYRALIGKSNWSDSQSEGFGICLNSSEILYSIKGSSCSPGQVWSGAKFTKPNNFDNNWQHIVMTFDGATKSIYMNNKLIEKSSFQHTPINCQGGQIRIGAWWQNDPQWFKGSLDDLGIWNRVLTQEEITALFQSSNTTISNSIIQTWKHTQGTFAKTEKKSINGLPIWNENNGQFQYEETSSSTTQTILRDLNRQGVLIKLTNDQCLYKDNGLTDYRLLYNGSWQNKPEINGDAESFYKKGLAFYESKNYSEALTNFTRAIEIKPDYRSAYWGRGYLRRTLDDHEGFLNDFKKVIELDPDIDINVFL
ncbi:MAG: tetratricopeptide repeat protein, partial [Bacteroidetes bacterium]|nr:tetratricopeptide repeat protein [Bacteroidota bacterium]